MTNTKREHWERIIEEWEASGLSQKAFCAARDLVYPTFCYWRQNLSEPCESASSPLAVACYDLTPAGSIERDSRSFVFETEGITLLVGLEATVTIRGQLSLGQFEALVRASAKDETGHAAR